MSAKCNFGSDNAAGASPEILAHIARCNDGSARAYGGDEVTARVRERLAEVFETRLSAWPVATGTAANALALSALSPPFGAVICHRDSHINCDECGAPEFFTGGAKLIDLDGAGAKITAEAVERVMAEGWRGVVHHVQPAVVSITQSTEAGTVYGVDEIAAISEACRRHDLALHMDGARFANALVALGCSPAEMTWKAGVDVLSFGATKNGALAAEAVIFFDEDEAGRSAVEFRRKRAGHLFSKMRFLSAQLEAYLEDDLWLRNARHANAMARRLADGLLAIDGVDLVHPVEANEIFAVMPAAVAEAMRQDGHAFHDWPAYGTACRRLVTAWNTEPDAVDAFLADAAAAAASGRARQAGAA